MLQYPFTIFARDSSKKMYRRKSPQSQWWLSSSSIVFNHSLPHMSISSSHVGGSVLRLQAEPRAKVRWGKALCPRKRCAGQEGVTRGQPLKLSAGWKWRRKMPACIFLEGKGSGRRLSVEFYSFKVTLPGVGRPGQMYLDSASLNRDKEEIEGNKEKKQYWL